MESDQKDWRSGYADNTEGVGIVRQPNHRNWKLGSFGQFRVRLVQKIHGTDALIIISNFRWFDISFNRLSEIKNLSHLVGLQKVFLCANRITKIENLECLTNLTTLELGDNRIRVRKIYWFYAFEYLHISPFLLNVFRSLKILTHYRIWLTCTWVKIKSKKLKT